MTISVGECMRQASMTVHDYALNALRDLCDALDIDRDNPRSRKQLAPFAGVLAAMVTAAAADLGTSMRCDVPVVALRNDGVGEGSKLRQSSPSAHALFRHGFERLHHHHIAV